MRERLRAETKACVGKKSVMPALQVMHAPVFYGTTFSACAELVPGTKVEQVVAARAEEAGFVMPTDGETWSQQRERRGRKSGALGEAR